MSLCSGSGEWVPCSSISAPFSRKYRIPHSYLSLSRIPCFVSKTHKLKKTNCCKRFKRNKYISRFNWYFYYEGEGGRESGRNEEGERIYRWVSTYYSYHTYYTTTTTLATASTLTTATTLTSLGSDHDMSVVRDNIRCFTSVSHQRIGEERRYHSKLAWLLGICR